MPLKHASDLHSHAAGSLDNLALSEEHHHHHHPDHVHVPGYLERLQNFVRGTGNVTGATAIIGTVAVGDRVAELKPDLRAIANNCIFLACGGCLLTCYGFGIIIVRLMVRFRKLPRNHILGILTEPHYRPIKLHGHGTGAAAQIEQPPAQITLAHLMNAQQQQQKAQGSSRAAPKKASYRKLKRKKRPTTKRLTAAIRGEHDDD